MKNTYHMRAILSTHALGLMVHIYLKLSMGKNLECTNTNAMIPLESLIFSWPALDMLHN